MDVFGVPYVAPSWYHRLLLATPETFVSRAEKTLKEGHAIRVENVSHFEFYLGNEYSTKSTRRLFRAFDRFCGSMQVCIHRFQLVKERLQISRRPKGKIMVDAATRFCYKTIAGSLQEHDGWITEEAGKHAMKLLQLLKPIFVGYIKKCIELLDHKVDKQRQEDLYVSILIASTSSVSMALRDYGSKVCEAAEIQVRTNLEPWPWVFHAGPEKRRWHVLRGLIKDYQLQQPRLVEIGVERGNLSEQLLEVPMVRLLGVDPYIINNGEYYSMAQPRYDVATGSRLYVGTSREALEDPELKDPWASIDLLFVDADHTFTAVLEDLKWSPRVRLGGVVAGHDFGVDNFGVQLAVLLRLPRGRVLHLSHDCVWWWEKLGGIHNNISNEKNVYLQFGG